MNNLNIRITRDITQKYILAEVGDNKQIFLWGNPKVEWHKDIVKEIEEDGLIIRSVKGGGKIKIISGSKIIYVWGKSSVYGSLPFEMIVDILKDEYSDYKIVNDVPSEE